MQCETGEPSNRKQKFPADDGGENHCFPNFCHSFLFLSLHSFMYNRTRLCVVQCSLSWTRGFASGSTPYFRPRWRGWTWQPKWRGLDRAQWESPQSGTRVSCRSLRSMRVRVICLLNFACLVAFTYIMIANFKDYLLVFVQVVPHILNAQA